MIIHGKDLPEINEKTKYDVIILAGQSNAVGFGTGETLYPFTPSDEMLEIIDTFPIRFDVGEDGKSKLVMPMPPEICLRKLQDRFAYERNNACLANAFAEGYVNRGYLNSGRKLLVIKTAVGGTGFTKRHWTRDGVCREKMYHMINEAKALSDDMRITAFLWHQGEHDAFERPERTYEERKAFYEKEFSEFISEVRDRLGGDFPIICGEFSQKWMAENKEACDAVLSGMSAALDKDGFGTIASSVGAGTNSESIGSKDILHFSRDGLHLLGRRYLEAFCELTEKRKHQSTKTQK